MDRVSEIIKLEADRRHMSLTSLSKLIFISKWAMLRKVSGKSKWTILELRALSRLFGYDELFLESVLYEDLEQNKLK